MLKEVVFASICFILTSGCALIKTADVEENQKAAATAASSLPEITTGEPVVTATAAETDSATAEEKKFGPEYVREIQTHLKRSGFYSGAVDGIAGAKTQSAIRHFQSGCATLDDLISASNPAAIQQTSGMAAKGIINKTRNAPVEAVRVTQVRLKDAGFDPGPIDGIAGAKTQSALLALESGCKMLGNVRPTLLNNARMPQAGPETLTRTSAVNGGGADFKALSNGKLSQEAIKALQKRLSEAGFDPGPIDGILGAKTKAAAQRYQSSLR